MVLPDRTGEGLTCEGESELRGSENKKTLMRIVNSAKRFQAADTEEVHKKISLRFGEVG